MTAMFTPILLWFRTYAVAITAVAVIAGAFYSHYLTYRWGHNSATADYRAEVALAKVAVQTAKDNTLKHQRQVEANYAAKAQAEQAAAQTF